MTRPDLADRAVFLTLEPIAEQRRRPEAELWAAFELERPRILGVLLDAVVHGTRQLPETRLEKLPRMADFALWASACETALWPAGTFWSAYCGNRDEAVEGVIDADPIAAAVRALMTTRTVWTGTAADLLGGPGRGGRRARCQVEDLAGQSAGIVGAVTAGSDLSAQGPHRVELRARGKGTDPNYHYHDGHGHHLFGARKRRGATVHTVRVVRARAKSQSRQRVRGGLFADGRRQCGR